MLGVTRVLGSLLLLAIGVGLLLDAPRAGAMMGAAEQRWRGRYANTDWTWQYRAVGVVFLVLSVLVALGVLRFVV